MPALETCTKCGSGDLMRFLTAGLGSIVTGLTIFSAVPVTRVVCPKCGFVEEWIESGAHLEKLRQARTKAR